MDLSSIYNTYSDSASPPPSTWQSKYKVKPTTTPSPSKLTATTYSSPSSPTSFPFNTSPTAAENPPAHPSHHRAVPPQRAAHPLSNSTVELRDWIKRVQTTADATAASTLASKHTSKHTSRTKYPKICNHDDVDTFAEVKGIMTAVNAVESESKAILTATLGKTNAAEYIDGIKKRREMAEGNEDYTNSGDASGVLSRMEERVWGKKEPKKEPRKERRERREEAPPLPPVQDNSAAQEAEDQEAEDQEARRLRRQKRAAKQAAIDDQALKRARETAVTIALARSRRRLARRCFANLAKFVAMEGDRLRGMRQTLKASKRVRVKSAVLRAWHAFSQHVNCGFRNLVRKNDKRQLRGCFSQWICETNNTNRVMDKFYGEAQWRLKGRIVTVWRKFVKRAAGEREVALAQLKKRREVELMSKAVKWHSCTLLGRVLLAWRAGARTACEERGRKEAQDRRRKKADALLQRVNRKAEEKIEKLEEQEEERDTFVEETEPDKVEEMRKQIARCLAERGGEAGEDEVSVVASELSSLTRNTPRDTPRDTPRETPRSTASVASSATPRSVVSMFKRHEERAAGRKALSARYDVLNRERAKRQDEVKWRKEEERRLEGEEEKREKERREHEIKERKGKELERRREATNLAVMHNTLRLLGGRWQVLKRLVDNLRVKEKSADVFLADTLKVKYFAMLGEYVKVRKELKVDLEARALRKADEYYYDKLCWRAFSAWVRERKRVRAMEAAVRGQREFGVKRRGWERWRTKLDEERLVWWELDKHAALSGRHCVKRRVFGRWLAGVRETRRARKEDRQVEEKMREVRGWLEK